MQALQQLEIIILLFATALALTTLARKLNIPYPILLVVGGLGLSLIPALPTMRLNPDLVFLVFLPPILWAAAYFTSVREFKSNLRPIMLLAIGLVVATTAVVAAVIHAIVPGIGWPTAVALGAIVSPPDAVAATAVFKNLSIPRRVVSILEGESLVNDASALVLYKVAVATAVTGEFFMSKAITSFFFAAAAGVAIGIVVSVAARWAMARTQDSFTEIAMTLLAPYIAWVIAERVHASAVLACVAGGIYMHRYFSVFSPATRMQAKAVWDQLIFLLNALIFMLIGLQLGALRSELAPGRFGKVLLYGAITSIVVIAVRLIWVPANTYIPRLLSKSLRERDPYPKSSVFLISWTGMRGVVSLAAALALPLTIESGAPFPFRNEIIIIAFCVIVATLVFQGLSLAPLIKKFKLRVDDSLDAETILAREHAATAALERLDILSSERWAPQSQIERMKLDYAQRLQKYSVIGSISPEGTYTPDEATTFRRLRYQTLSAERIALIEMRNRDEISDEVLHLLEHELDVESMRAGLGDLRLNPSLKA